MWCRSHDLLAQVRKKGGGLRHWSARMPVLRSRSPGEKHTCANSPLHLRQCREERIPLRTRFRGAALAASRGRPRGSRQPFRDHAAVGPSDLLSVFVTRRPVSEHPVRRTTKQPVACAAGCMVPKGLRRGKGQRRSYRFAKPSHQLAVLSRCLLWHQIRVQEYRMGRQVLHVPVFPRIPFKEIP